MKIATLFHAKHAVVLLLLAVLTACGGNGIEATAKFQNTTDIKPGASVYFNGRSVGEVADVSGTENGSVVKLGINPDAAAEISSDAAVVVNRIKPGAPLEIHNPAGVLIESLQAGQSIKGIDSMLELMAWSVGDAINEGGRGLTSLVTGFQGYLQGDDFQREKDQITSQMKDAADIAGNAMKRIEQDLGEAFEDVLASEQQMANAIDELSNELSPMVEEMSKSGTELALQMERFAQRLEQATPEERQSGERLMQSITEMLEKLNDSMDKGAKQTEKP